MVVSNIIQSLHLNYSDLKKRELKYASLCYTKKHIFDTNSTEVELIPGYKQPNK